MRAYRARWVLPICYEPIRDGLVAVREGRVVALGTAAEVEPVLDGAEILDLGESILMPGLVNAHTHLALTHQLESHPRGQGLIPWLESLVPAARAMSMQEVVEATRAGLEASRDLGTALVGEICSRPEGITAFLNPPTLRARVFFEFLGVSEERARASMDEACLAARSLLESNPALHAGVRPGLSPHAPYSVWPELWTRSDCMCREEGLPWTTHLAESPHEEEFLRHGTGPIRDYLAGLGVLDQAFSPLGRSGVELLDDLELLDENALLVHGVHLTEAEISILSLTDAAVCLCPRSNAFLGLPAPPAEALYEAGVFLCLGTDSLASNEDLSVWAEIRALHALAPGIPPEALLQMATANGAMALGFAGEAGVIHAPGPASLIAVEAPGLGDRDPHAYLAREAVEDRVRVLEASNGLTGE